MIQNQGVTFPRRCPQAPANHLDVEHFRLCGPRQNDAAHIRIKPSRQHPHIADNLNVTILKPLDDVAPVIQAGIGVHVLSLDASLNKPILDMLGMDPVNRKADCRTIFATLQPSRHDVSHQRLLVHCAAKTLGIVVPCNGLHPSQIRMGGSIDPEVRQVA